MTTKCCTKCGEEKLLSAFCKQTRNRDGLSYWCDACKRAAMNEDRAKNPEKWRNWARVKNATPEGRTKTLINHARSRSKELGRPFDLTPEWIISRVRAGACEVTGIPFSLENGGGQRPYGPSLDRRDPTKGYTQDNTQVVCWMYNAAKSNWSHEDVMRMARALCQK